MYNKSIGADAQQAGSLKSVILARRSIPALCCFALLNDPVCRNMPLTLREVLPRLASELEVLLRSDDESKLADRIDSLEVVDRCRCDSDSSSYRILWRLITITGRKRIHRTGFVENMLNLYCSLAQGRANTFAPCEPGLMEIGRSSNSVLKRTKEKCFAIFITSPFRS